MKHKLIFRLFLASLFLTASAHGREITDMSGRQVVIPDSISKVFAVSPPGTYLLYAIKPTVICGLNFPLWENEKKLTLPSYRELPVIGGLVGQSRNLNREVLLKIKPDFLLYWAWRDDAANKKFAKAVAELNFPLVSVRLDSIYDYPQALRFLAEILNEQERGRLLSDYALATLKEAEALTGQIPEINRVKVYYAEGPDGLSTERARSLHAELIPLAGGINVHLGDEVDHFGMEKVSMEQILIYDPEVILIKEKIFFDTIRADPRWRNIRAVRDNRLFLIPDTPFNWFDRPPSFMRLLGVKWLMHIFYPDIYKADMLLKTKEFYKLFLGVDLDDNAARKVLHI